jgi:hypothetical protein
MRRARISFLASQILTCAVLLLVPAAALAQGPDQVDSVKVSLWPEYDRPDVLVIYRVQLPSTTVYPARIALPIPPDAPDLTAAAFGTTGSDLLNAEVTRSDGEQADLVEVLAEGPLVQIEYYLPLDTASPERQFTFTWPGGLTTAAFVYEVQQPIDAEGLVVDPSPTSRTIDEAGVTYHLVDVGPLSSDATAPLSFSYSKTTPDLTASVVSGAGLAQPEPAARDPIDWKAILPWLLLIGGVGLVAAGLIFYLRSRAEDSQTRPRHRSARTRTDEDARVDASPVYCHNCGTQATAADRFCRQCGTALRT